MLIEPMISEVEIVIRLVLAAVIGGIIGFERELTKRPAGLRTNMLVCIGSALITLVSIYGFPGSDPSRVAAQIVVGIGFLGAGTIFKMKDHVIGLTTAATLWVVAGIGIAVGTGLYFSAMASVPIILAVLWLSRIEKKSKS
jgi:putative Mg2+ transporter-C (MgtC) family protein